MSGINLMMIGAAGKPRGSQSYTTAGTYTWVAPAGVTSVSVVAIGGGYPGGGGGGLGYKNNYSVTPGASYTVVVGAEAGISYFVNTSTARGSAGSVTTGGGYAGDGGGTGGSGRIGLNNLAGGGGGAGGYSGNGGNGGGNGAAGSPGATNSGAGGGGGSVYSSDCVTYALDYGAGGGGVGLNGIGTTGAGGSGTSGGGGGSGGNNGNNSTNYCSPGPGGTYGGGGGTGYYVQVVCCVPSCGFWTASGGAGAVRIVWPGCARTFPSTDVGA